MSAPSSPRKALNPPPASMPISNASNAFATNYASGRDLPSVIAHSRSDVPLSLGKDQFAMKYRSASMRNGQLRSSWPETPVTGPERALADCLARVDREAGKPGNARETNNDTSFTTGAWPGARCDSRGEPIRKRARRSTSGVLRRQHQRARNHSEDRRLTRSGNARLLDRRDQQSSPGLRELALEDT